MNWKEQLSEIEKDFGFHKKKDWKPAIDLVNKLLSEYPDNVELNIRGIYILHNILVEEEYSNEEQDILIYLLPKWFNQSRVKFSENAEYLFFIGEILHIAEWYFGLEDTELALEFHKKAMEKEPGNVLYEWAYRFSYPEDVIADYLANQIITNGKDKISWLETRGFPGEYILERLKMSSDKYLAKTS